MEKYGLDRLSGVYWERVLTVGFFTQQSWDECTFLRSMAFRFVENDIPSASRLGDGDVMKPSLL
jgi:hypothetical protein